ncbi:MAG: hypothetical protein RQ714_07055 [Nitrosomonas sp.]|nr:hypothetical protein [Nitrosomonas sp.]
MSNLKLACMFFALLGLITSDPVWARGGHGGGGHGGGGHHIGGGGHRSFGGGFRHFSGRHHFGGSRHGFSGRRHHFGGHRHYFGLGLGYFYPGFYGGYRPYYRSSFYGYSPYYQRAVPAAPIAYVQREEIKTNQSQGNYWHYCMNPEGYYPDVKQCPEGWLKVAPR